MSLFAFVLALVSSTQSDEPRKLTAAELQKTLPGTFIEEVLPAYMRMEPYPERFDEDGSYTRYGDNEERVGKYWIKGNRFCVVAKHTPRHCRHLFVDSHGRLWMSEPANSTGMQRITIKPTH